MEIKSHLERWKEPSATFPCVILSLLKDAHNPPRNCASQSLDFKKMSQKIRIIRNALFFILGVAPAYHRNLETRERVHQMYSIVIPIQ